MGSPIWARIWVMGSGSVRNAIKVRGVWQVGQTSGNFHRLDEWIHRRLRMLQLKQWKRGRTAFRELRRKGVPDDVAAQAARFMRSWWRGAAHKALHIALPGEYFRTIGAPNLA